MTRRPTPPPLTKTERTHLDDLIRRGARAINPAEGNRLLRLLELDQADRAQERRTTGGLMAQVQQLGGQLKDTTTERDRLAAELEHMTFVQEVLEIFFAADCRTELMWRVTGNQVTLSANVSDVFAWGCADGEDITPERLPILRQAHADLKAIGAEDYLAELYAARVRCMRPQGAAYPETRRAQALFDACGPEREVDLGNPRRPPLPHGEILDSPAGSQP